jgi:hypothetical protein
LEEALNQIGGKTRLIEVNCDQRGSNTPREMNSEEPFDNAHKVDFATFGQKTTEELFDRRVFGEIDEIVNVETKGEWTRRCGTRWGLRILDESSVETRVFKGRG